MWIRSQAGQVARELGLPGPNNADYPITKIPVNEVQGCTIQHPQGDGARDGVLFLDGSRGYNGNGSTAPFDPASQDRANSRLLATDTPQPGQDQSLPDGDKDARYLTRIDGPYLRPSGPGNTPMRGRPNSNVPTAFDTGAPPIPFVAPSSNQDAPGGLLGMMIRAGVIDSLNPDQPAPGGLPGLILRSMRDYQNDSAGR
jgi:hypothetical protein